MHLTQRHRYIAQMASAKAMGVLRPQPLIACNVYVSAGRSQHADALLRLVSKAQGQCHSLRAVNRSEKVAVIHAYSDEVYDRSSFHLAGNPDPVVAVASGIINGVFRGLLVSPNVRRDNKDSRHPFVGIVDHVSFMPLGNSDNETFKKAGQQEEYSVSFRGRAARSVGKVMSELGVDVHYYGDAHPDKAPLATVRRERTRFFDSGGLRVDDCASHSQDMNLGAATVGAPPTFVENYNVRLRSDQKTARSLTRFLRERDGGLAGVEALTLPYGEGRYEIACNLLRPDVVSLDVVEAKMNEWTSRNGNDHVVETAYRVGTTADQCLEALSASDSMEGITEYDETVMERLRGYLLKSDS